MDRRMHRQLVHRIVLYHDNARTQDHIFYDTTMHDGVVPNCMVPDMTRAVPVCSGR
jgi:hypothetical protein